MKIFVVFGSASDEPVSKPLVEALGKHFDVEYEVISAHRDLEKLQARINSWKGDAIVAGAGLAAALPGVVAAMTPLPVFGVPVPSQFGGLDSLCSIAQMPPGVPVMTCGPHNTGAIVSFLKGRDAAPAVHFVAANDAVLHHPDLAAEIAKAEALGRDKNIPVTASTAARKDAFNVYVVTKPEEVRAEPFCLHMPFLPKKDIARPEAYLPVLGWTEKGGLWVGVNNTRNAVQSALRLRGK